MTTRDPSLGQKILSGTFWTVGVRVAVRFLGLVSVVILARLLTPEDFGLVAKAVMVFSFLELITTFGLESALISNQQATRAHYDTAWTITIMRGMAIGLVLIVAAGPIAAFFHEPDLVPVIYCYAAASALEGFSNIGTVDFQKELKFHLDFRLIVAKKLTGFITTIVTASLWHTYWALVVGVLASTVAGVVASYALSSYRPRPSRAEWRSLFHFSKWMLSSQLITALSMKLDTFLLSRFSTTNLLGTYTVSYEIAGTPSTEIAMPVARAMLPGLAKLADDRTAYRDMYVKALGLALFVALPAGLGVSVLATEVALALLGPRWTSADEFIRILALFGIARALFAVSTSAYIAFGRVDILTRLSVLSLGLRAILLPLGLYLAGETGLAWGLLGSATTLAVVTLVVQERLGMIELLGLAARIWRVAAAAAIMYWLLAEFDWFGVGPASMPVAAALLLKVIAGAAVYVLALAILTRIGRETDGPERTAFQYIAGRFARHRQGA